MSAIRRATVPFPLTVLWMLLLALSPPAGAARASVAESLQMSEDAAGSQGFAFYMWLAPTAGGEPRPFTLYTVREGGRIVVANVVPDQLVEGRHQ